MPLAKCDFTNDFWVIVVLLLFSNDSLNLRTTLTGNEWRQNNNNKNWTHTH